MITVYDAFGIPHLVTLEEFIMLEAKELEELFKQEQADPVK